MMGWKRWLRRGKTIAGGLSLRLRIAAALLAVLAVGTAVYLIVRPAPVEMVSVLAEPLDDGELSAAIGLLDSKGICAKADSGKLLCPRDQVDRARGLLAYEGLLPHKLVTTFEDLARQNDVWSTSEQNAKRWQAAKMATLSKEIAMFPPVRQAVVIYEPGAPRRLGGGGVEPTASVKVILKSGAAMDRKLAGAIADLVSGSIAGMSRRNVRIVDNSGESHHVGDEDGSTGDGRLEQLRAAEAFYHEKIQTALHYIENTAIGVRVEADGGAGKCLSASVSIPRSYFVSAYKAGHPAAPAEISDAQLADLIQTQNARIGQTVAQVVGLSESAVKVDWFYDLPEETVAAAVAERATATADVAPVAWILAHGRSAGGWACISGGVLAALWWIVRRVLRRDHRDGAAEWSDDRGDSADSEHATESQQPFVFLHDIGEEDLLAFIHDEHPQTLAMILAHLPPIKSAAILTGLPQARQVEVTRRIAGLERIDAEVVAQVEASVKERLEQRSARPRSPGLAAVAKILRHAPAATERAVMSGLSDEEPALADSLRRRMLVFEDIVKVEPQHLREALDDFDCEEMAVALRTAGEGLKKRVLGSLSPASSQRVAEEMEQMGPVRLGDVEAAQQRVAQAVRLGGQYVGRRSGSELIA